MIPKLPIFYGRQAIDPSDIDDVVRVLKSDFLTQGPEIEIFENAYATYVGSTYAVAVSNGTAALHLCAMALGVSEGQKVITSPLTFAASANCIRYCGGEVVFADIDPDTYLLDVNAVKNLLKTSPRGTYQGIIPVDFAGRAVNLEAFRNLANKHGLWIIEDACHAPGGYFADSKGKEQKCGNGMYADLAIFSFHPVKHITSGEGGMITTNDEALYKKLLKLRTHGITKHSSEFTNSPAFAIEGDSSSILDSTTDYPGWYMEMQNLGYNYRLTDFQAALGTCQLKKADSKLKRRKEIAAKYNQSFASKNYILNHSGNIPGHAYHLYVICTKNRLGLYNFLREHKVFAQVHYIPLHLMPYYRQFGWKEGDMPHAENYYRGCLSLPMYPTLTDEQQDYVISLISTFFETDK
jgi:UDP-4-amino-4,6-dideoxy-N-acetyl-beta-L-altrosamine transaminase